MQCKIHRLFYNTGAEHKIIKMIMNATLPDPLPEESHLLSESLHQICAGNNPLCPDGKTKAQREGKPYFLGIQLC